MSRQAPEAAPTGGPAGAAVAAFRRRLAALGLPRNPADYLRSPGFTRQRLQGWLNARLQLRACTRVGRWTRVSGRVHVRNAGSIVVGERVQIISTFARSVLVSFPGGRLEIGDRTLLNYGADIAATRLVRIGRDCLIGTHVTILDSNFHGVAERHEVPPPEPVTLGDGVWIGNGAIILPGVTIGSGTVIGAGSVVTRDVPPRSLAAGNPARVIKQL